MYGNTAIEFALLLSGVLAISIYLLGATMKQAEPRIINSALYGYYVDNPDSEFFRIIKEGRTTKYYTSEGIRDLEKILEEYTIPVGRKYESQYIRGTYYDVEAK